MSKTVWTINAKDFSMSRTSVNEKGELDTKTYTKEQTEEIIRGLENLGNVMFDIISDFEKEVSKEFGLDASKATMQDILKIIRNIMSDTDMYTDVDKSKIVDDKSSIFS